MPEAVKAERLAMLQTLLNEQQAAFNQASVGKTMSVLLERPGRRSGQLVGRSPYMQAVHVSAPEHLLGHRVEVGIEAGHPNSLAGSLIGGCPAEMAGGSAGAAIDGTFREAGL